jgi:UDP-3-O-[3-hydroxymyristoyl] glucosamine N-acyltransferase
MIMAKYDPSNPYSEMYETSNDSPIHWSTRFGKNVKIGHGVVIEKGCKIGNNVRIGHNCVIKAGVTISDNTTIKDLSLIRTNV